MAAFAQSNEGDVSPNTKGPHCMDSGKPCNFYHSTCHGEVCHNECRLSQKRRLPATHS